MVGSRRNPLWQNTNFLRLWLAQAVSVGGDYVFNTTVVLWIGTVIAKGLPWAPEAVSGVLVAAGLPSVLVAPVAGVLVDRWDRRATMMAADLVRALLVALMVVIPYAGSHWSRGARVAMVYVLVALTSSASQFFNPARFALIASIVPDGDRPQAFGMAAATSSTAAIVGPPLAAPLLFTAGVQWALVANAASYLISFAAIRTIRVDERRAVAGDSERPGLWREYVGGLGHFARNRVLRVLAGSTCVYMLGVGAVNALNVFFVADSLHAQPRWLGILEAGFGIGSIAGAFLARRVVHALGESRTYAFGIVATGVITVCYSRSGSLTVAVVLLAAAGVPLAWVNVVSGPIILRAAPPELIGRVNSLMSPLTYLTSMISMALAGLLDSTLFRDFHARFLGSDFHGADTIFAASGLLVVAAGVTAAAGLRTMADTSPVSATPQGSVTSEIR